MAMTINTNITAMTAQRYLGVNNMKSSSSLAKLSSGSRVPSAKDDAAGLAVGSKLRAEVNALQQASQNAAQAVSMLQIADGALSTIGDILVRMKSLATQSSSGQLGSSERALLDQEFDELRNEITRIAGDTDFNGTQLLNGGDVVAEYTELKNGGLDGYGVSLSFDTNELGADEVFRVEYDWTDAATDTGVLKVSNLTTGESQSIDIATIVQASTGETATDLTTDLSVGDTVDVVFDALGVTLTLDDRFDVNGDFNVDPSETFTAGTNLTALTADAVYVDNSGMTGADFATFLAGAGIDTSTGVLTINLDSTGTANTIDISGIAGLSMSTDGVTWGAAGADLAGVVNNDSVYLRVGAAGDAFMRIDITALTSSTTANTDDATLEVNLDAMFRAEESTSTAAQFDFRVGTGAVAAQDEISITINAVSTSALGIGSSDIGDSQANAESAIDDVTAAINTISSRRANIGASQSRLEFAAASIAVSIENVSAAQSGLLDVDVSQEMTEFTSKQVLLQAGISMLAQANQQPALLLRLLQ